MHQALGVVRTGCCGRGSGMRPPRSIATGLPLGSHGQAFMPRCAARHGTISQGSHSGDGAMYLADSVVVVICRTESTTRCGLPSPCRSEGVESLPGWPSTHCEPNNGSPPVLHPRGSEAWVRILLGDSEIGPQPQVDPLSRKERVGPLHPRMLALAKAGIEGSEDAGPVVPPEIRQWPMAAVRGRFWGRFALRWRVELTLRSLAIRSARGVRCLLGGAMVLSSSSRAVLNSPVGPLAPNSPGFGPKGRLSRIPVLFKRRALLFSPQERA